MIIRAVPAAALVFGIVANAPRATEAQRAGKIVRVAILDLGTPQLFAAFRDGMREPGYVNGKNVVFEVRSAQGKPELIRNLAVELVRLNPDVIVTAHGPPSQALQQATRSIPIVVAVVADAVAAGLVTNLHRPGGNVTGLSFLNTELTAKRLELPKEALSHIRRVAMLNDVNSVQNIVAETETAAQRLGVELQRLDVHTVADFADLFEAATRGRAQAIDVLPSAFFNSHRARIVELAAWSARSSSGCGIVSPSALAALRLIISSNFVGCSIGSSPGFAPLRILSTYVAARRAKSRRFGPYAMKPPAST